MNLYIILRRTRSFFVFFFPLAKTKFARTAKKKISFQKRDQNRISVFVPPKSEKKESKNKGEGKENRKKKRVTSIFTLFRSLSALSALDALFKDEFHARKRHIFVAVVVL